jgi:GT2 family glycosyltransferase
MNRTRVSILIPVYNAERWVGEAIESALAQTYPDKEVLVHDDGSTDGSLKAIRSFGGRVRWAAGRNRGVSFARNELLSRASGSWLQYLDADDYLLPRHVERQVTAAAAAAGADVVYSPITDEYWEQGQLAGRRIWALSEPHDPHFLLARWQLSGVHGCLFRRQAVVRAGGWMVGDPGEDYELLLRLIKAGGKFVYAPDSGAVYRHWSDTTLSKRNPARMTVTRLATVRQLEQHLLACGAMTSAVQAAIAQGRLECARSLYAQGRKDLACAAVAEALDNFPGYSLPDAPAFPRLYRLMFRLLGFVGTERLAAAVRPLRGKPGRATDDGAAAQAGTRGTPPASPRRDADLDPRGTFARRL